MNQKSWAASRRVWLLLLCALRMQQGKRIFLVYTEAGWQVDAGEFSD